MKDPPWEPSKRAQLAGTLISNSCPPDLGKNKFLLLFPPTLWCLIIAAWEAFTQGHHLWKKHQDFFIYHLPNMSKESNQATEHKLPSFQNGVIPCFTNTHLPLAYSVLCSSAPRIEHQLYLGPAWKEEGWDWWRAHRVKHQCWIILWWGLQQMLSFLSFFNFHFRLFPGVPLFFFGKQAPSTGLCSLMWPAAHTELLNHTYEVRREMKPDAGAFYLWPSASCTLMCPHWFLAPQLLSQTLLFGAWCYSIQLPLYAISEMMWYF